jgi:hypothetical protein
MKFKLSSATFLFVIGLSFKCYSAKINCPDSIIETPQVISAEKDWKVMATSGVRRLDHIEIYLGNPSDGGVQIPDSTKIVAGKEIVEWKLKHANADVFWISCSYIGTTAILIQKLDSKFTECIATYELLKNGRRLRLISVDCH